MIYYRIGLIFDYYFFNIKRRICLCDVFLDSVMSTNHCQNDEHDVYYCASYILSLSIFLSMSTLLKSIYLSFDKYTK